MIIIFVHLCAAPISVLLHDPDLHLDRTSSSGSSPGCWNDPFRMDFLALDVFQAPVLVLVHIPAHGDLGRAIHCDCRAQANAPNAGRLFRCFHWLHKRHRCGDVVPGELFLVQRPWARAQNDGHADLHQAILANFSGRSYGNHNCLLNCIDLVF